MTRWRMPPTTNSNGSRKRKRSAGQTSIRYVVYLRRCLRRQIATLRRENRTLIEANNKLHSDVVAATEQMDALERKTRSELTEAHNAANNYRYQLNTQSFRVKAQETDIARLKHKITVLLERSQAFSQADLGGTVCLLLFRCSKTLVSASWIKASNRLG